MGDRRKCHQDQCDAPKLHAELPPQERPQDLSSGRCRQKRGTKNSLLSTAGCAWIRLMGIRTMRILGIVGRRKRGYKCCAAVLPKCRPRAHPFEGQEITWHEAPSGY